MIYKIFISILTIMLAISFGQVGKVSFNKARLVPKMLNYQGYLTDTLGSPITDNLDMTFKIFDAVSSGNELWSETQTNVPIEHGVFSVMLGETTLIPDSVFADFTNTWLELTLEGPQILSPRTRITSVGYAYTATYSDTAEYARNALADTDWVISGSDIYSGVSGNVGIGTATPSHKLEVTGNIHVAGDITWQAETSYVSIPPAAFFPHAIPGSEWFMDVDGRWFYTTTSPYEYYFAPAQLPHSATITKITFYWYDLYGIMELNLLRSRMNGTSVDFLTGMNSGTSGYGSDAQTSISNPTIDNSQYVYYFYLNMPQMSDDHTRYLGAVVQYVTTKP
jgi:hypothetical protein